MTASREMGVIVFSSPVAVGHVRPMLPLAHRLVERGYTVLWAISGDDNEPAAAWRGQLAERGVQLVDIDDAAKFTRGNSPDFTAMSMTGVLRRVAARANDVSEAAAAAIRTAAAGQPIVAAVYDYFALWSYVAMRRLGIANIDVVISAFPAIIDAAGGADVDDPVYRRELAQLASAGFGSFDAPPRSGLIPRDPGLRLLSFSSPRLCPDAPQGMQILGVQRDVLPRIEDITAAPAEHQALAQRLQSARDRGARVVLLSMGTVVTKLFTRLGGEHVAFLKRLYTSLAASALRSGAIVVASTCNSTAAELGVDEAALGPAARDRVIALPFVPQPFLFAHELVDVMLMHGGANTFHEAVVCGIPLLISPAFGDQEHVAHAVARLGLGACIESITIPALPDALSIERIADDVLPAMLVPGITRWKAAADALAVHIKAENGLDAAEALVLGRLASK